ncbi:MAG TPA: hypothetical protein PKH98_06795, partial [Candidatus Omnitrophota bacterium]|nr:hypothetical protein [Candidatus Omnitrophota bacterium]
MGHSRKFFLINIKIFILISAVFLGVGWADITVNILAVNGTDQQKEKKVNYLLPLGIEEDDVLDSAGLEIDYNIEEGRYFVHKDVVLGPKETKTFKVRMKDIWTISSQSVNEIKQQIDENLTPPA